MKMLAPYAASCLLCAANGYVQNLSNPGGFINTDPRSPYYNSGNNLPPAPGQERRRWKDRWGAIALDGQGNAGIVVDLHSERAAQQSAIKECRSRGGSKCEIRRSFVNQCAAVIADSVGTVTSSAPTAEESVEFGVQGCHKDGGVICRVYQSGCSLPERVG